VFPLTASGFAVIFPAGRPQGDTCFGFKRVSLNPNESHRTTGSSGGTVKHRTGVWRTVRRQPRYFRDIAWVAGKSRHWPANDSHGVEHTVRVNDA
jgi:hypothetical protein